MVEKSRSTTIIIKLITIGGWVGSNSFKPI
jgi:hypothetical protein